MTDGKVNTNEVKRGDLFKIPYSKIQVQEGLNIRKDFGDMKELVESIRQNGIKVPLRGFKNKDFYTVTAGHRRLKAAGILAAEGIEILLPMVLHEKGTTDEAIMLEMFTTNDGKPLTALEMAEGISRLIAYGWNEKEIAAKLGKSTVHVNNLNRLAQLPKAAKKMVENGTVSATFMIDRIKENTVEDFLADSAGWQAEHGGQEGQEAAPAKGKKKKQAKLTTKHLTENSLKNFKRFSKQHATIFPTTEVETVYWIVTDIAQNKWSYDDMVNYFMDGKKPDENGTTTKPKGKGKGKK